MSYLTVNMENLYKIKSTELVEINCDYCNKSIFKQAKYIRSYIKKGSKQSFCDNKCQANFVLNKREIGQCKFCNKEYIKDYKDKQFCSIKCSSTYISRNTINVRSAKAKKQHIDNPKTPTSSSYQYRKLLKNNNDLSDVICKIYKCKCSNCGYIGSYRLQQKYCNNCSNCYTLNARVKFLFTFNVYDYPELFNLSLIEEYGWFNTKSETKNLNGVSRDHKVSISDALKYNYDPYYIKHQMNCELMLMKDNLSKSSSSSLTYEELVELVDEYDSKHK